MNMQASKPKVGREYQHLEDLVIVEGVQGVNRALNIIRSLIDKTEKPSIKWDGILTVYWGRENGRFGVCGKHSWGKKLSYNSSELHDHIISSGKNEPWRPRLARDMKQIFEIFEENTPHDMSGFVFGDILFQPNDPAIIDRGKVMFCPNKVTYQSDVSSRIGSELIGSVAGVAIHQYYEEFGQSVGVEVSDTSQYICPPVKAFSQTNISGDLIVNYNEINDVRELLECYGDQIDCFFKPIKGLSDLRNILYRFVNHQNRTHQLMNIDTASFNEWIINSTVSSNKQFKIIDLQKQYPDALSAIFAIWTKIMDIKNHVIVQLDYAPFEIQSFTGDQMGGEGYVLLDSKIKLVPRHRWKPI